MITFGAGDAGNCEDGGRMCDGLRKLEVAGADVVGFNYHRGMETMLPLITEARGVCKVHSIFDQKTRWREYSYTYIWCIWNH